MTLKSKMSLLVSLTSISIISVGFSSWSITAEGNAEIGGNIKVDNVIDSKEFIRLDTTKGDIVDANTNLHSGIDTIDYCETSFMNKDGLLDDTGTISTYFIIDQGKCKSLFIGYSSLKLSVTIKYSNNVNPTYNIFDDNYDSNDTLMSSFRHSIACGKAAFQSSPYNIDKYQYTVDFSFENLLTKFDPSKELNDLAFTINYSVFSKTGNYFTDNIYNLLSQENMQFTVSVALSSY